MKAKSRVILWVLLFCAVAGASAAVPVQHSLQPAETGGKTLPRWVVKTNLLYDATATFNLGAEFRMGRKTTLDIPVNYNPWTFKNNRKWKHILVQPGFRWWLDEETFSGNFVGVHAHGAFYNVGNLPHGPFSQHMKDHRFEGWLAGVGVSYGHRWNFRNPRWAVEAEIGVGYAYLWYDKFMCGQCGERLASETKHYVGPTKAAINLVYGIGVKDIPVIPVEVPVIEPKVVYEPIILVSFITPEVEAIKTRSESGQAYLDFRVGRWEIVPSFRNNTVELQKIHNTIESVKGDPDVTITSITITGYASPEDYASRNQVLSENRAKALRDHVATVHGLNPGLISAWGAGEDWAGFDSLVAASGLVDKYQLLEIIRGSEDIDRRETRLKTVAGGAPYRQIKEEIYPRLRRSDYRINYTVVPFTVEKGKEVMRTRPSSLSLNELFLIANTYEQGSEAFNEVFETAARVFPESDVANVNAAANALGRKDVATAAYYLARVKVQDEAYWNNLGVLQWLQGDKVNAAESFAKAGALGLKNASELETHIDSIE